MRTAVVGVALLIAGLVSVATGVLPGPAALAVAERVWPVLAFVVAITVVTELAAEAGLFRLVAERTAAWGGGRAWVLWLMIVLLAVASTVFLSLDTTAVLLTPVVILVARHAGLPPLPFALTTIWMANTASLLLPVSNLTNLLAVRGVGGSGLGGSSPLEFAALMLVPAIVAIVLPASVVFLIHRRELLRHYVIGVPSRATDRPLLVASGITVAVLLSLLVSGVPVWIPATVAALVLGGVFFVRRRSVLRFALVPWRIVLLASGLFLLVEAAHTLGLGVLLESVAGTGDDPLSLLRLSGVGAFGANAVNNLPAYLALEPVAGDPIRLAALLIGVNVGPLVTPWASLATLLWHRRLVSLGVRVSWRRYCLLGLVVAPVTVAAATLALAAAQAA